MASLYSLVTRLFGTFKMLSFFGVFLGTLAVIGLYALQSFLIYPSSLNDGRGHCATPDELGMPYEHLYLPTPDGEKLQCYVLKQDPADPQYTNKTVVILSPNAGNIGHALQIVAIFYKTFRYNVVIYSYRGYGKSLGKALEAGLKIDADTVLAHIAEDQQLADSSLVLYGRSLGGAVAIYMAATHSDRILALVLENTFLLVPKTVPHIFPLLKHFTMFVHQKWDSELLVPKIPAHISVLLHSARRDEIVPPAHMDRINQLLKSQDKAFYEYPESGHNDTVMQPLYWQRIHDFIRDKVNPRGV